MLGPVTGDASDASQYRLTGAALVLLGDGATAAELAHRFAEEGATLEPGIADGLLGELLALGLVRVGRREGEARLYLPTSLGRQAVADGIGGVASVQLADLEAVRSDLLSTIAHELRTPLTVIRTSIGLLTDDSSSPTADQRRTLLDTIARNADRMQRVTTDILDLTRFRAGHIRLQLRQFDASDLARGAVASVGPVAVSRHQTLSLEAPASGPLVYGDRRRLEQALVNLISNAIRFSPEGAPVIVAVDTVEDQVRWRVEDVGPGISDEDQARLFERFFVGPRDRHGSREGVGLGLPTALAIAQAHGGTITVESEVGVGSTFGLVVPVDGPAEAS